MKSTAYIMSRRYACFNLCFLLQGCSDPFTVNSSPKCCLWQHFSQLLCM